MSLWVGISPLIGAGSLEGFAVGATVSGAFFLAITAPRRVRRRQAVAAGTRGGPASTSRAETGSVEIGALDAGLCGAEAGLSGAEAFAEAGRVAQPQPGAQDDASPTSPAGQDGPTGQDGRAAAYRSRHRLGDPIPDGAARGGGSAGRTPLGGGSAGRTPLGGGSAGRTRRGGAFPRGAFRGWASRDHAQPDTPLRDVASCDVAFPDGAFGPARRPEVRRLPRHAAPAVSFGTKVSGRVTGLFATRPLAGGAPS
jgi:hypothetical protein